VVDELYKRLERNGKLDLVVGDKKYLLRYYELLTRGKWIYYECIRDDSRRMLLRFDFENYEVTKEPLDGPAVIARLHRYKFVPAEDKYSHLEVIDKNEKN